VKEQPQSPGSSPHGDVPIEIHNEELATECSRQTPGSQPENIA
jgi:hypothetical protein